MQHTPLPGATSTPVRLDNGLTVVLLPEAHSHQVLVSLMLRTGSRHEREGENGLTHMMEHLLFRGNALCPDTDALNLAFEAVGSVPNGHTSVENTGFELVAHPAHLPRALELMAALVGSPGMYGLEKERRILLDELAYDYNQHGALINTAALMGRLLWPEHPLGRLVGGTPQSVQGFTGEQVRALHQRNAHPGHMVLALAGALEPQLAMQAVQATFGALPPPTVQDAALPMQPAPPPLNGGPRMQVVEDDDNQVHLHLAYPAPGDNDPAELAIDLLCRVLDDGPTTRLQRIIREDKALVYHIQAGYTAYSDAGQVDIVTSVQPRLLEEVLGEVRDTLGSLLSDGPTQDEVERARMRCLFDLDFEADSLGALVDRHAWPLLHGKVRTVEEERAALHDITREQLHALARELFAPGRLHVVAVGPDAPAIRATLQAVLGPLTNVA